MIRRYLWLLFFTCQWLAAGWMIMRYYSITNRGEVFRFKIAPADPADPFRGRYLNLRYEASAVRVCGVSDPGQGKFFIIFRRDSLEFAMVDTFYRKAPESSDNYLESFIEHGYAVDSHCYEGQFHFPFSTYYLNEALAVKADQLMPHIAESERNTMYAEVRIYQGKAVLKEVYINSTPMTDWLRKRMR